MRCSFDMQENSLLGTIKRERDAISCSSKFGVFDDGSRAHSPAWGTLVPWQGICGRDTSLTKNFQKFGLVQSSFYFS